MGSGVDLQMLDRDYAVTGSDSSKIFIDLYRATHPDADLLELDAQTIQTDRAFDCVYYTESALMETIGAGFETVAIERYKEMEEGDAAGQLLPLLLGNFPMV